MSVFLFVPREASILLGAFQRSVDAPQGQGPIARRASGGPAVRLGAGVVWVQHVAVGLPPDKILNRAVRPLLRALTKASGRPVHYFGRDWIACGGRPVGIVAFAHEAASGRAVFEAFVAARESVALDARASFLGKPPSTLEVDPDRVVDAVSVAYGGDATLAPLEGAAVGVEPAWLARAEEAIGPVCAGPDAGGVLRLGGELMASADAVSDLEARLRDERVDVGAAVDDVLGAPSVALFGVRSRASIRDVLVEARKRLG